MSVVEQWHELLKSKKTSGLSKLLADDVVFYSPVVHTPQKGKAITTMYLSAAFFVFFNDTFKYVRETVADDHAILEFQTIINGVEVNGVDMITWNDDGQITEFKVMVRPLKAIQTIHEMMKTMLEKMGG
jgi:ketosteroid isomerase-like protein